MSLGSVLAFISALSYSTGYILIRTGVRPGDLDGGAFITTFVNAVLLGGGSIVLALVVGPPALDPVGIAWFAVAGVLGPFAGRILMFAAIHRVGPVRSASVVNTAPLVTIFLAVAVLGEELSPGAVVATALVALGFGLLLFESFQDERSRRSAAPPAVTPEAAPDAASTAAASARSTPRLERAVGTAAAVGLGLAALSAVSFGVARATRRLGLDVMPEPLLGAAIGAAAGLATHVVRQAGQRQLGAIVRASIRDPRPRLWVAGTLSALGLATFFLALTIEPLAHVAVIAASETVITLILGSLLLRSSERLSARVAIPALCVFAAGVIVAVQ